MATILRGRALDDLPILIAIRKNSNGPTSRGSSDCCRFREKTSSGVGGVLVVELLRERVGHPHEAPIVHPHRQFRTGHLSQRFRWLCHAATGLLMPWSRGSRRDDKISYAGYRFPPEIIQQTIWLYLSFTLSLRDVEDLLAEQGVTVSYETVRRWVNHFGPMVAADLRNAGPSRIRSGILTKFIRRSAAEWSTLWRAVDAEGEVLDVSGPIQAKQACRAEIHAKASEEICLCTRAIGH